MARVEFSRRQIRGVPAFLIGDEVVVGLDTQRIYALLDYTIMGCKECGTRMRVPKNKGKIKITCPNCSDKTVLTT
ncbi:RNase P subunit RPR2 [Alkaliphilus hydrothermalis]|uniref:RNase P subunit RPR2 n=1 Tax=Alkaliphilus hydrothermalis TaxID=1482730 RepID=A0ABS2NS57_9FIRM|nr:RNase P subunit RPR2 [Alkaliphilus hydrothermalis]